MAIDFPSSPTVGQQYTYNGVLYTFTAQSTWTATGAIPIAAVGFRATKGGVDQTGIANGATTKVTFGTEEYDRGGFYDPATSRWTPPAGLVHMDVLVYPFNVTGGFGITLFVYKNGANFKQSNNAIQATEGGTQLSVDDVASGSDYYEVYIGLTTPSTGSIVGNVIFTAFSGHVVGGPTGAAGPPGPAGTVVPTTQVGFRANKNGVNQTGVLNGTVTKITFGTEVYDQGGYYDPALSRWTPPAGAVHIESSLLFLNGSLQTNTLGQINLFKNGALLFESASAASAAGSCGLVLSADDVANGSDYYEVFVVIATGGTGTVYGFVADSWFAGHVVGGPAGPVGPSGASTGAFGPPQGRLTNQAGTPVLTTSSPNQDNLRYTPYVGDKVPIYDGTNWTMMGFTELVCAWNDTTKNPAAQVADNAYDYFVWNDAGVLRLGRGPAWTDLTTRSAGTALTRVNGLWVNQIAITNGPAAARGTYVGTVIADGVGRFTWNFGSFLAGGGQALLMFWNCYNRVTVSTTVLNATDSWTISNTGWRMAAGSNAMRITCIFGLAEDGFHATYATNCVADNFGFIGVSLNALQAVGPRAWTGQGSTEHLSAHYASPPMLGRVNINAVEMYSGTTTAIFVGRGDASLSYQGGLVATVRM